MKGRSQQILELLFINRIAYTKEEIAEVLGLQEEKTKVRKTLYDMHNKRGLVELIYGKKYRISSKGCNHAVINYGMSSDDIVVTSKPTKPAPLKQSIERSKRNINNDKPEALIPLPNVNTIPDKNIESDLENALNLKSKGDFAIKDLDQKLEVLGIISKLVDDKLSYWLEEIKKDLEG